MRYSFYIWDGGVPTSEDDALRIQYEIDAESPPDEPAPPPTPAIKAFIERCRTEWPCDSDAGFTQSPWRDSEIDALACGRRWSMELSSGSVHWALPRIVELANEAGLVWWDNMIEPRFNMPSIWEQAPAR